MASEIDFEALEPYRHMQVVLTDEQQRELNEQRGCACSANQVRNDFYYIIVNKYNGKMLKQCELCMTYFLKMKEGIG